MIQLYLGPDDPADATQAFAWDEVGVEVSFHGVGENTLGPEFGGFTRTDVGDMDRDGDLDIVATFPTAPTMNVRWYRNPTPDPEGDPADAATAWQVGLIPHIATGADVVAAANVTPEDDLVDALVRSSNGPVIQWLRRPEVATTSPARAILWQVYTLAEFSGRAPSALAVGNLNFHGQPDVIASATGTVARFDVDYAPSVFDQWGARIIIDDLVAGASIGATDPGLDTDQAVGATFINSIIAVDLDGDGANDLIATLDRPGINNDAIAWLRNDRRTPR